MDLQQTIIKPRSSNGEKNRKIHLPELDHMSVLFCLMILFVHSSSYVITGPTDSVVYYHTIFALWKLSMSAIYGFIFVSGIKFALSIKENFSILAYYRSRLTKIFIPYVVATAVYYTVRIFVEERTFDARQLLRYILNGEASAQLYFIIVIMGLYLLAPLWLWLMKRVPCAVVLPVISAISLFILIRFPNLTYQDNVFFKCIPFWLAGCYIGRAIKIHGKAVFQKHLLRKPLIHWIMFLLATALYLVYTHMTHASGTRVSGILGMVYAAFFIFFVYGIFARFCREHHTRSVESAAQYTYFVFLDHCLFVDLVNALIPAGGWIAFILHMVTISMASWITAYILQNVYTYMVVRGYGIKKLLLFLLNRVVIVSGLILLQFALILAVIFRFYEFYLYYYTLITLICLLVCVYIINSESNPSYKIAWITVVLGFNLFGLLLYLVFHGGTLTKQAKRRMLSITDSIQAQLDSPSGCLEVIEQENRDAFVQSSYIVRYASCPPYCNSACTYFASGEEMFERLFDELERAEKYIFLEFFIFKPGQIFDRLREILVRKAKEGVDVRLLYDDVGSIRHISSKLHAQLSADHIKVKSFNPYVPVLSALLNNRDHRKIVSIDGKVAFTGGVNVADEYANIDAPFGHWKDAAVMVQGEAAWSFTVMFLSIWNYLSSKKHPKDYDYLLYKPEYSAIPGNNGYVQPYTDSPLDSENVSETIYLNMINRAQKYVYISSPYLALDNEMLTAICNAAKSGVDVRMVMPGIPDKRYVNQVTKSYYEILTKSGVRVYEYTPGFNHAKVFICDDLYATVGSVNLDFRSLYLSFECGVWLYRSPELQGILEDYSKMIEGSREITYDMARRTKLPIRIMRALLRFFSPLM